MVLKPQTCERAQVVLVRDQRLRGEDIPPEVVGQLGRDLVLQVARGDGRVQAPDVKGPGEIVADEGNLVLVAGCVNVGYA